MIPMSNIGSRRRRRNENASENEGLFHDKPRGLLALRSRDRPLSMFGYRVHPWLVASIAGILCVGTLFFLINRQLGSIRSDKAGQNSLMQKRIDILEKQVESYQKSNEGYLASTVDLRKEVHDWKNKHHILEDEFSAMEQKYNDAKAQPKEKRVNVSIEKTSTSDLLQAIYDRQSAFLDAEKSDLTEVEEQAWATEREKGAVWLEKVQWLLDNKPQTPARSWDTGYRDAEKKEEGCDYVPEMGQVLNDRYTLKDSGIVEGDRGVPHGALGKGHFSTVWLAEDKTTGEDVAVKILRNAASVCDTALAEIEVLEAVQGMKNVMPMLDHFQVERHGDVGEKHHEALVFPLFGPDLCIVADRSESIWKGERHIPMAMVKKITKNMLEFFVDLHAKGMLHTDLKPENVLLYKEIDIENGVPTIMEDFLSPSKPDIVSVGDLGNSEFLYHGYREHKSVITTRYYRAPETLLRQPEGTPCDIWAVGTMAFELITGNILFGKSDKGNSHHIKEMVEVMGDYNVNINKDDDAWKSFVAGTWKNEGMDVLRTHFDESGKWLAPEGKQPKHWDLKSEYPKSVGTEGHQCELLDDFLLNCILKWDPDERWTASELLTHEWLKVTDAEIQEALTFYQRPPTKADDDLDAL